MNYEFNLDSKILNKKLFVQVYITLNKLLIDGNYIDVTKRIKITNVVMLDSKMMLTTYGRPLLEEIYNVVYNEYPKELDVLKKAYGSKSDEVF